MCSREMALGLALGCSPFFRGWFWDLRLAAVLVLCCNCCCTVLLRCGFRATHVSALCLLRHVERVFYFSLMTRDILLLNCLRSFSSARVSTCISAMSVSLSRPVFGADAELASAWAIGPEAVQAFLEKAGQVGILSTRVHTRTHTVTLARLP